MESSMRAREAELSALKAQINPHFLYNSLNSISALTSIDPARAREMCVSLADFLRLTLGMGEKAVIPLSEENWDCWRNIARSRRCGSGSG